MRTTLIASSVAVLALAGLAGGAAYAAESDASPGATPTTMAPGMDIFADMGLTPEQGDCLVANVGTVDTNDLTALMALMTQCEISMDQLMQIGQSAVATTEPGAPETTTLEATPSTDLDPATVAAVLALMGLGQTDIDCLVSESEFVAPTDDLAAEAVLATCGVGALQVLEAIVALDAQAGGIVTDSTVSLATPTTVGGSSGNAMVDLLLEQLAAQGIILDAEQGQCLLDNISDFDPNDMTSMISVMETCGIDIADLLPSG